MSSERKPKIGEGHAGAWGRQGLDELRNSLYPESNVVDKHAPYGIYGTKTPGEVAEDRRGDGDREHEPDDRSSIIRDRLPQGDSRDAPEGPSAEMELE